MENRRKLRESGLVLIILGIVNLFMFVATIIGSIVDGTVAESLANVDADVLVVVKALLIVIGVIMALLAAADAFLGIKAIKVSKNPTASKGYITAAKVFMIMTCIAAIYHIVAVFSGDASAVDSGLNLASLALSICIYNMFIKAAEDVRQDVLNAAK